VKNFEVEMHKISSDDIFQKYLSQFGL